MIDKSPLVSVIMNCFNGEKYLRQAIDSIYTQSYKNWEIIFWDNASTDSSSLIAKGYDDRLKYFHTQKTTPLGLARNLALVKANGKYVSFLDCDDEYLPEKKEMVKGTYKLPDKTGEIRIKITDLLSESLEVDVERA